MGFMFNIDGGYLEGLCRGFKCGILKQSDYLNLVQCETLEGKENYFVVGFTIRCDCKVMLGEKFWFKFHVVSGKLVGG